MRQIMLALGVALCATSVRSDPPRDSSEPRSDYRDTREREAIVTSEEISVDFEDLLGRRPSDREVRYYEERARSNRWNREQFREDFRHGDEYRELTPERIVDSAFREVYHRGPSRDEEREYIRKVREERWTYGELRRQLRDRPEVREGDVDRVIDRIFLELLDRRPDVAGRNHYRDLMLYHGLTEDEMVRRIRDSQEYKVEVPNARVTRAYQTVFHRNPDPRGLENYRRRVVNDNWREADIEQDLRRSAEYREEIDNLIRRIHREVLGRDPDPKVVESYRRAFLDRGWTEAQLREDLRRSDEHHDRRK